MAATDPVPALPVRVTDTARLAPGVAPLTETNGSEKQARILGPVPINYTGY